MSDYFQKVVEILVDKGINLQQARLIVGLVRAAEDYTIALKLQDDVVAKQNGKLGGKVAQIFRQEDINLVIKQASENTPSPNQCPAPFAQDVAVFAKELFRLQEANANTSTAAQDIAHNLDKLATTIS